MYLLFVPKNYDSNQIYDRVGFLHGAGERDTNKLKQVTANDGCLDCADDSIQNKYPSFIAATNVGGIGGFKTMSYWGEGNYVQEDHKMDLLLQGLYKHNS